MKASEFVNTQEVVLERIKFGVRLAASKELLEVNVDEIVEEMSNRVAFFVHGFIWGETGSVHHKEVKYPKNWWQAFKLRWFPVWAKRRWPVEYEIFIFDVKAIYPTFKQIMPGNYQARLIIQSQHDFGYIKE
jgi:hypothetical protein